MKIENSIFEVICEKNVHIIERDTMKMCKAGWYPVGGIGRKGLDWVQVFIKENDKEK